MSTDALSLPDPESLPDDPALLRQLILQLLQTLRSDRARIEKLQQHMDWLVRRMFGRSREKLDPRQLALFDALAAEVAAAGAEEASCGEPALAETATAPQPTKRKGHGRRPKPDHLKRVEEIHDLTEAEKQALAGDGELVLIGEEVTEQYELEPSSLYIVRHVQKKYVRRPALVESGLTAGEKNVITAPKPPAPIPGGIAGPGLLAHVLVSHFVDHLPFHRQQSVSVRFGQFFSRQTTDGWCLACAELLEPLYEQLKLQVLASHVIHTDDTPVKVCDAFRKLDYTGRFWIYWGDERYRLAAFDYTCDRSRDGPEQFLKGYRGYLQADAYGAYDALYAKGDIVEVACWAHARRKFFDHQKLDQVYALTALAFIRQLYGVERELSKRAANEWRPLELEERARQIATERQAQALPVLEKFHTWLETESVRLLPKNALREATNYVLGNWAAFRRYIEDGQLAIDNNAAERALRRIAVGRRNWLFRASDRGGRAAAIHYSLLTSCERNGLNPFTYLRHVLRTLPTLGSNATPDEFRALLPDRCRAE
jgi:transposase